MTRLRDRLGASGPGLVVAVVAVILALGGAAFAAGGKLTGQQTTEVKKIAKKYAGKPGAAGAPGAAGPQGSAGPAGAKGEKGEKGEKGTNGTNGTSVVATPEPTGTANCNQLGGSKFVAGTATTFACNGKEGSPWTDGGTLPSEAMETGSWLVQGTDADKEGIFSAISFPIPLAEELDEDHVIFLEFGLAFPETNPECTEGEEFANAAHPHADPGYLCVFNSSEGLINTTFKAIEWISEGRGAEKEGTNTAGARLAFTAPSGCTPATPCVAFASGTFAVTAP
jgi:hypothetical protein